MKNKNLICLILCFAVLISCMCTIGFATSSNLTISAQDVQISTNDDTFSVPVIIGNNTGVAAIGFDVTYNAAIMELTSVGNGTVFAKDDFTEGDLSKTPYTVSCMNASSDNAKNGMLVKLNFKLKTSVSAGMLNNAVKLENAEAFKLNETQVNITTKNSTLTIIDAGCITISANDIYVEEDTQTVDVEIDIDHNPGVAVLGFDIAYNSELFELTNVKEARFINTLPLTKGDLTKAPYSVLAFNDTEDAFNIGRFLTLTFTVKAPCEPGKYAISLSNAEAFNYNEIALDVEFDKKKYATTNTTNNMSCGVGISEVVVEDNTVSFTADVTNYEEVNDDAKVTAIMYDANDKPVSVELEKAETQVDFNFDEKGTYVKVLVVSNKNLKPLSKPLYYKID